MEKDKEIQEDKEKTRDRIIRVAIQRFSTQGYHGTTVDQIVDEAQVNKRMVYHYFKDKADLYRAVHRRGWEELKGAFEKSLVDFQWDQVQAGRAEQTLLVEAMRFLFDFAVKHPLFHRLILWDALEGAEVTRSLWGEIRGPLFAEISQLVATAQDHGLLPKELKINHLIITSLGLVSFYFTFANSMQEMFSPDPLSPEGIQDRKEQVLLTFRRIIGMEE